MTKLICHVKRETLPSAASANEIHVWLYGRQPPFPHVGSVGARALELASRLRTRPSAATIDFLSIAMAVTAADTFVLRDGAADCWSRSFLVELPLAEPERWTPLVTELEAALRFLSSDTWSFKFRPGGIQPPTKDQIERRRKTIDLKGCDAVALFSGGLDSAIGVLDLLARGSKPVLVSHSPTGDAEHQDRVAALLPTVCPRASVNAYPTWSGADDDSMRTRSFQFIALGALVAEATTQIRNSATDLHVCENGFIALNPPLSVRRLGAHSTRTAHVHFLESVNCLLRQVGIDVSIRNPYGYQTKGEMLRNHAANPSLVRFASETVSCGKWKRRRQQCGRCLPCLIRRAALHHAGVDDLVRYQSMDLKEVLQHETWRDDLVSVGGAILRMKEGDIKRWVLQAGPLPPGDLVREQYFDVARRGLSELASYLAAVGILV